MMIRLKVISRSDNIIIFTSPLSRQLRKQAWIMFGAKKVSAQVYIQEKNNSQTQSTSPETPAQIIISSSLKNELLIHETLTYQIKIHKSKIVIGPVIGLMLGNSKYYRNIDFLNRNCDRLMEYKQKCGLICAFSWADINWRNKTVYGYCYNWDKSIWERGKFPIPDVVYKRYFHVSHYLIKRLKKLTNDRVFNSYRFTKYELYKYFQEQPELSKHLPPTELCQNIEQVKEFIESHSTVILKPVNLSRGIGICVIKKTDCGYEIFDYRKNQVEEYELKTEKSLVDFLIASKFFKYTHLMQKYISLARIEGYPYDIRVVMQKVKRNQWKYMGEECRVSRGNLITNISRGGYATLLEEAIAKSFQDKDYEEIKNKVRELCNKICCYMDKSREHYAEFGIDIGIDEEKNIWIIEINVLPSYDGFRELDINLYLSLRSNPLSYAVSLTDFEDNIDKIK